jgi:hypothetical protein
MKTIKSHLVALLVGGACLPFFALACGGPTADGETAAIASAVEACTFGAPVVTEVREETPGAVAPGIGKVYFVTVRNTNSTGCGPATVSFIPDSFMFFSIVAQPSSAGGVASGATTTFRVTATSDPSVVPGTYTLGFTVVANPGGTSTRGALTLVVTLDNPTGCNRQRLAIAIDNPNPPPVPPQTAVVYHVTVRNVDNRECGPDLFHLSPFSLHFVSVTTNGPFTIPPQGSAVFDLTIQASDLFGSGSVITESFDVFGDRHVTPDLRNTGTVTYRVR